MIALFAQEASFGLRCRHKVQRSSSQVQVEYVLILLPLSQCRFILAQYGQLPIWVNVLMTLAEIWEMVKTWTGSWRCWTFALGVYQEDTAATKNDSGIAWNRCQPLVSSKSLLTLTHHTNGKSILLSYCRPYVVAACSIWPPVVGNGQSTGTDGTRSCLGDLDRITCDIGRVLLPNLHDNPSHPAHPICLPTLVDMWCYFLPSAWKRIWTWLSPVPNAIKASVGKPKLMHE